MDGHSVLTSNELDSLLKLNMDPHPQELFSSNRKIDTAEPMEGEPHHTMTTDNGNKKQSFQTADILGHRKGRREPIPLITMQNNLFRVNEECFDLLSSLKGPLAVVGIAGTYRTGKSFILNQLLGRQDGFEIGPSVRPCTKGIWLWSEPVVISNRNHKDITVLFLDTEGLGSFSANETYDAQIFALSLLLSSYFIYNSLGSIDDNAIKRLGIVTELTRYIRTRKPGAQFLPSGRVRSTPNIEKSSVSSSENDATIMPHFPTKGELSFINDNPSQKNVRELANIFPDFLWLVRDFTLELTDSMERPISSREYLDMTLQNNDDTQDDTTAEVKERLKEYFVERNCFTLVRPITNEKKLQRIGDVDQSELRIEFKNQVEELKELVFGNVKPKVQQGIMFNGRMFLSLCQTYCHALNEGGIVVDSCWETVVRSECESAFTDAKRYYKRNIKQYIAQNGIVSLDQLEKYHLELEDESIRRFVDTAIGEERNIFERDLIRTMREEYHKTREKLQKGSNVLCVKILNEIYMPIDKKITGNDYKSFASFEHDINELIQHYSRNAKGSEKNNVLLSALLRWFFPNARQIHDILLQTATQQADESLQQRQKQYNNSIEQMRRQMTDDQAMNDRKLAGLEKSRDTYRAQCNNYKASLWEIEETLSSKDNEIIQLKHQLRTIQDEMHSQEETANEQRRKFQEQIAEKNAKMESLQDELRTVQTEVDERTKKAGYLEELMRRMEIENESLSVETQHQQLAMEQLEDKNKSLRASIAESEKEVKSLKAKCESSQASSQNLEETLIQTEQVLKQTQNERAGLITKSEDLQERCSALKKENAIYENKFRRLERDLVTRDTRIRSFEKQLEREMDRAADNEDRLRRSIKEKDRLLKSNREHQLEQQVEKLNETNRRILQINKTVMEENRKVRGELSSLGSSNGMLFSTDLMRSASSAASTPTRRHSNAVSEDVRSAFSTPKSMSKQDALPRKTNAAPERTPSLFEVEKMYHRARGSDHIAARPKARRGEEKHHEDRDDKPRVTLTASPKIRRSDRYSENKENEF